MAFAINTRDGRISVWVEGVSNCCYHPIPDDVAKGVSDGTIKWESVVNAINRKRYMDRDFDWTALREAEDKLNVRTAKFEFADEAKGVGDEAPAEVKNAISMADVTDGGEEIPAGAIEGKKATAKRTRKAKEDEDALGIFDDGAPEEAK